ncbi:MAG TPA: NUDIX domain-containing protein [Candidatus Saccharimonadales bacterium]|nr:NUDIX domain-containing protein [Candidatus Saccharimonadales bacterium]
MNATVISTGKWAWTDNLSWELLQTNELPPAELCTAVLCVAISDGKVILAQGTRGWGVLGGHIEANETLEQTLHRELMEEGGYQAETWQPFAVRKVTAKQPQPHQRPGQTYPFPVSYLVYYLATTNRPLVPHTAVDEIITSRAFGIDEIAALHSSDEDVIRLGWQIYQAAATS